MLVSFKQLGEFILIEHTEMYLGINLFFKSIHRPVAKNDCPSILSYSPKPWFPGVFWGYKRKTLARNRLRGFFSGCLLVCYYWS